MESRIVGAGGVGGHLVARLSSAELPSMRRTLAVLALLATSWPHVMVLECALGSVSHEDEHEAAVDAGTSRGLDREGHGHEHHGHHPTHHPVGVDARHVGDGAGPRAEPSSSAPVGGQQCAMVMACGLVMMQSGAAAAEAVAPEPATDPSARALGAPAAFELTADTPPPRRNA